MGSKRFSIPYMLGIDAVIVGILLLVLTGVIVFAKIEKPDGYFTEVKKYSLQENYRTEETMNEKEISKAKLDGTDNGNNMRIEEYTEVDENII